MHYAKVLLDEIFGRECFLNEIIWAYDYGARTRTRWPAKHDNILWYVKDPEHYTFNADAIERIPYMAPGAGRRGEGAAGQAADRHLVAHDRRPTGKEKTGYPTQKPLGILRRMILASSNPGDMVLDFFAGSGTTGVAATIGPAVHPGGRQPAGVRGHAATVEGNERPVHQRALNRLVRRDTPAHCHFRSL